MGALGKYNLAEFMGALGKYSLVEFMGALGKYNLAEFKGTLGKLLNITISPFYYTKIWMLVRLDRIVHAKIFRPCMSQDLNSLTMDLRNIESTF